MTQDSPRGTNADRLTPSDVFEVPEGVEHLDAGALARLEQAFRRWRDGARRVDHQRSRTRVLLLFLVLRHSGAKLGEVLDLDEREHVDGGRDMVLLGKGEARREVPLPRAVCREIRAFMESPLAAGLDGQVFHLDPGYVRRTFYSRAEDCGIPRRLGAPSALRRSRAVEMLRSGVPLGVVREVLGQSSANLAEVYQQWSRQDVRSIVRRLAIGDGPVKSSARNSFTGHVRHVRRDVVMAEVELEMASGQRLCAVITAESLDALGIEPGVSIAATVKAPHVEVRPAPDGSVQSTRNCLLATVSSVRSTEVLAEVSGVTPDGFEVCALVSTSCLNDAPLRPGDVAEFRFKALSVVLAAL